MKFEQPNCIKIGALNCQGLRDKIDYLEVQNLISSCDIFGVTETWYGDDDNNHVKGYGYYPLNRKKDNIKQKGGPRGGIGIFIKK